MTIGDLVKYRPDECDNQVPGLVVGFENIEASVVYFHVQWFDWAPGEIAIECSSALVLIASGE